MKFILMTSAVVSEPDHAEHPNSWYNTQFFLLFALINKSIFSFLKKLPYVIVT